MLYGTKADKSKAVTYDKEELDVKFENVTPDLPDIDDTPTANSDNLVKSGGVQAADLTIYRRVRSILGTSEPPNNVLVASNATVWLATGLTTPSQGDVLNPNYLITFSGDASFDDGGAIGQEGEGLVFTISRPDQPQTDWGAHWALKATNIGGYGHFNFFHLKDASPNQPIAIKVTNNTSEDVYISNMRFNVICL